MVAAREFEVRPGVNGGGFKSGDGQNPVRPNELWEPRVRAVMVIVPPPQMCVPAPGAPEFRHMRPVPSPRCGAAKFGRARLGALPHICGSCGTRGRDQGSGPRACPSEDAARAEGTHVLRGSQSH